MSFLERLLLGMARFRQVIEAPNRYLYFVTEELDLLCRFRSMENS